MTAASVPALGAWALPDGSCRFRVWAPQRRSVEVVLGDGRVVALAPEAADAADGVWRGHWSAVVAAVGSGVTYRYRLDADDAAVFADPASMAQPDGVHGPSAVVAADFAWGDADFVAPEWPRAWVIYEVHVGTFTSGRTFDAAIVELDRLAALGVTAVELMPVGEFPGDRNWGYDGVFGWAAHHAYGGLDGLRRFVDAAHARGLAVVLDVVHNHLGPEGNVLASFGPYFSQRHRNPWTDAVNVDGPGADEVREFFCASARFWAEHAHIDALRLDAVHAIVDTTAYTFLEQLGDEMRGAAWPCRLIAESADNDPFLCAPQAAGGRGLDGQWADDFHHSLRVALTGDRDGYYADFAGVADVAEAVAHGFVFRGRYSPYLGRSHGRAAPAVDPARLVVCAQNHDQVGNRMRGERLGAHCSPAQLRLAALVLAMQPSVPLLFMGEEYASPTPFAFFCSHTDPGLIAAVRAGRRAEFASFAGWAGEPPDPQDPATFAASTLPGPDADGADVTLAVWYGEVFGLRRRLGPPVVAEAGVDVATGVVWWRGTDGRLVAVRLSDAVDAVDAADLALVPVARLAPAATLALTCGDVRFGDGALRLAAWSGAVVV